MATVASDLSRAFRENHGWQVLAEFAELLRIPNVTGETHDLRRNAAAIKAMFEGRGATMEIIEIEGASPVLVGELRTSAPTATIGVYVHYDGQPVDESAWRSGPFDATLMSGPIHAGGTEIWYPDSTSEIDPEWRIYARGASDDKAPLPVITAALDALDLAGRDRTVNLVFLFEGEEESGSPNLDRYLSELAPRLQADVWLLCDGPVHQTRLPQVAFGARGYSGFELTFFGPERELHSGHYGNWVPNPAAELAQFLSSCKDSSGTVTIPGFYDDTRPLSDADRAAVDALPPVEQTLQDELGFGGPEVDGSSYADRLMLPSFNVRGLAAADVGPGARNVIPSEATASVDMRLAAGDDPATMVRRVETHLKSEGYVVLDSEPTPEQRRSHRRLARLVPAPGYRAVRIPMESEVAGLLLDICARASGGEVVALPTFGGSIPLYLFEDMLKSPVAVLPIANHDNNQHAADENIRIANLWYGIDLWATLLTTDFSAVRRPTPSR
jgi:acetylornithine deacetylase/succinyl-diaminopimelate desuccinylase-like protein